MWKRQDIRYFIIKIKINIIVSDELLNDDNISKLYSFLIQKYKDVILDDRGITFGKKIKDSELIGIPWTIIAGKNYIESGKFELVNRLTNSNKKKSLEDLEKYDFEKNFS